MPAGAARRQVDQVCIQQPTLPILQAAQLDLSTGIVHPAPQSIGDGAVLLKDFLQHKVGLSPFFKLLQRQVDLLLGLLHRLIGVDAHHLIVAGGHHGQLVISQVDHVPRVGHNGGGVRRDEHLALADTQYQGAAQPRGYQDVGIITAHDYDPIRAYHVGERQPHRLAEGETGLPIDMADVGRQHLRIGVAGEHRTLTLQKLLEGAVILDDAVMHQPDFSGAVEMRVGIAVAGLAVGGPAGMSHTHGSGEIVRHGSL